MKYYKCDTCGRIATPTRFEEENWETIYFDADGVEVIWEYDEKLKYFYSNTPVINTIFVLCVIKYIMNFIILLYRGKINGYTTI